MLKTAWTFTLRSLSRRRGYVALNVGGLAIAVACGLLIALYVHDEWRYDRFHPNSDRILRMVVDFRTDGDVRKNVATQGLLAPALEADLPEVEHAVRLIRTSLLLRAEGRPYRETAFAFADPATLEVFDGFTLLHGDPAAALDGPDRLVLTAERARAYFGTEDALGRTVATQDGELTVTGVLAPTPSASHLRLDGLVSLATAEAPVWWFSNWQSVNFLTYVLLRRGADPDAFRAKLPAFVEARAGDEMRAMNEEIVLHAQALTDVHLRSDREPGGNLTHLYFLGAIGGFVLLIAGVNFTNLATAYSADRAKEVGVRKTLGAGRRGLAALFLGEALLQSLLAVVVGFALAQLALPGFEALTGKTLPLVSLGPWLGALAAFALVTGLLAGAYPAVVLASFRPAAVLKGRFGTSRKGVRLRQALVVLQLGVAIALVAGTGVVVRQLHYMQSRDLGFDPGGPDRGALLTIPFGGLDDAQQRLPALKEALRVHPAVQGVTSSLAAPAGGHPTAGGGIEGPDGRLRDLTVVAYLADTAFARVYGLDLVAGEPPRPTLDEGRPHAFVINETAAAEAGFQTPADALGRSAGWWGYEGEVVGVVRDFHTDGLQHAVRPLALVAVDAYHSVLTLRVSLADLPGTIQALEATWGEFVPEQPFSYAFLEEAFGAQYEAERRFARLFGVFAALAVFVACLGLLGLAAFTTRQRTKEIGIRKVLGASVGSLLVLLTRGVAGLTLVAFAIAVPIVLAVMRGWLDDFAYRADIGWLPFAAAGLLTLTVAAGTVAAQSLRTATADPVRALRSE